MWWKTHPQRISYKTNINSLLMEKNYYQNMPLSCWVSYIPLQQRGNF